MLAINAEEAKNILDTANAGDLVGRSLQDVFKKILDASNSSYYALSLVGREISPEQTKYLAGLGYVIEYKISKDFGPNRTIISW